jgi:hypothetical protein
MKTFFQQAINSANKEANNKNPTTFQVGDNVVIYNEDYYNEKAIVTGHSTNLLGLQLIQVKTEDNSETSFYPSELRKTN